MKIIEILEGDELDLARAMIEQAPSGDYTLSKLYGKTWGEKAPNERKIIGKLFKETVSQGRLSNIEFSHIRSDNSSCYRISK